MRRNEGRFSAPQSGIPEEVFEQIAAVETAEKQVDGESATSQGGGLFSFTVPTEFVELPSKAHIGQLSSLPSKSFIILVLLLRLAVGLYPSSQIYSK